MANTPALSLVYATITFEGVHCWLRAPEEVKHLRNRHRHIFHVKAVMQVNHDDRDVEFIMLGHRIREWILKQYPKYSEASADTTVDLEYTSCEALARALLEAFGLFSCEVSEDNENGAIIIRQ